MEPKEIYAILKEAWLAEIGSVREDRGAFRSLFPGILLEDEGAFWSIRSTVLMWQIPAAGVRVWTVERRDQFVDEPLPDESYLVAVMHRSEVVYRGGCGFGFAPELDIPWREGLADLRTQLERHLRRLANKAEVRGRPVPLLP